MLNASAKLNSLCAPTGQDINEFYNLRRKRSNYLGHIAFLLSCKKNKVIPNFINVYTKLHPTTRIKSAIQRCHRILLRTVIKDTRGKLAIIEAQLYRLHLKLCAQLPPLEWNTLDNAAWASANNTSKNQRFTHRKKMDTLINRKCCPNLTTPKPDILLNKKIVNLSNHDLSPTQQEVLELGLNFSITKSCDKLEITTSVENCFKFSKLHNSQKDFLRAQIAKNVCENQQIKPNLSNLEIKALREIKNNPDLIISKADKGGSIVILNQTQYNQGLENILNDGSYSLIEKGNPLNKQMTTLRATIKSSSYIDDIQKRALIPSNFNAGRMYILPKIHKPVLCFRPIISCIGTPSYFLAKWLNQKLSFLSDYNTHTVKNANYFISHLKSINELAENTTMVSFDVVSLFTNVPVKGACDTLKQRLIEVNTCTEDVTAILKLVECCTSTTLFSANQKLYCQTKGLPMGGPLSPLLCDIYLHYLEEKILQLPDNPIRNWSRYVDDVHALWSDNIDNVPSFLEVINDLDPYIKFTVEIEKDKSIPFLDILITRTDESFHTQVYRKDFAVHLPPHARSSHPFSQKVSAFYSYVKRAIDYSSNTVILNTELSILKHIARDRGYNPEIIDAALKKFKKFKPETQLSKFENPKLPYAVIPYIRQLTPKIATILNKHFRVIFKPTNQISTLFRSLKDVIPMTERWGIYYIPCECDLGYIGQTRRNLKIRLKEHTNYVKKCEINKSNIAKHSWECNHNFKFNEAKIIKSTHSTANLDFLEAFHITKFQDSLVNDSHFPFISNQWYDVIQGTVLVLDKTPTVKNT